MPESPEVRNDADQLDFYLSGRELRSIELINPLFEDKCDGLDELEKELPLKISRVRAKAKRLFIFFHPNPRTKTEESTDGQPITCPWFITITYGMTGNIGRTKREHSHVKFVCSPHRIGFDTLYYTDPRRLGSVDVSNDPEQLKVFLADMAKPVVLGYPEEEGFSPITKEEFTAAIAKSKSSYLAVRLMNQRSICSGVGNYILSEIFYEAGFDPYITCDELTPAKIDRLWNALYKVIGESLDHGGMSMSDYRDVSGRLGKHEEYLKVYGKQNMTINNQIIHRCKGPHGRSIFFTAENGADTLSKANTEDDEDEPS